ncbi:MAG: outer membrane protein assembly factor BamA [Flavobacteriales bacterium AspAUS03]
MKRIRFFLYLPLTCILQILSAQTEQKQTDFEHYNNVKTYTLSDIEIKGVTKYSKKQILDFTHLRIGEAIQIPGNRINYVIKKLWGTKLFSDVVIYANKIEDHQIYLQIYLEDLPELSSVEIRGIKKSEFEEMTKDHNIKPGTKITNDLTNTLKNDIKKYYLDKGYPDVSTTFKITKDSTRKIVLNIYIDKGPRIKIKKILFEGNKEFLESQLRNAMKHTKRKSFFAGIFKSSKYIPEKFKEDCKRIIEKYQSVGFRDARVVSDSIWKEDPKNYILKIKVEEGKRYFLGDVTFVGNTVFSTEILNRLLTYKKGDLYDLIGIQKNAIDPQNDASIVSTYLDEGYLFNKVIPVETAVKDNKVDVEIRIIEGKAASFNKVTFSGNTVTKDHIIARELGTRPGDLFSKINIKRTMFRLASLGFFEQQKIIPDIKPNPVTNTVDLEWKLTEKSASQVQLQGGYGAGRIIGSLALTFGNFSMGNLFKGKAWNPVPQGDGQRLSVSAQAGSFFQSYGISFKEPWIGGKTPTSLTFGFNYSRTYFRDLYYNSLRGFDSSGLIPNYGQYTGGREFLGTIGVSVGIDKQLTWPDDYFSFSTSVNYERYNRENTNLGIKELPKTGVLNDLNFVVSLRRISAGTDPIFPTNGSEFDLTGIFTLPYSLFNKGSLLESDKYKWLEYYKLKLHAYWYKEILGKLVVKMGGEFGFLGYYNSAKGMPPFQRFYLGGTGLLNYRLEGRDYIPLRGYPNAGDQGTISPRGGGVVYNRLLMELRYPLVMSEIAKIWALSFFEAGNTFNDYKQYKPFELRRAVGAGVRIYMPAFGFLGFDFGYGFDRAPNVKLKWQPHFIIGRDL